MEKLKRRRSQRNIVVTEEIIATALKKAGGIQTKAARMLGISQSAVSQRVASSEYLQEVYSEIRESLLDLAEDELIKKLKAGHMTAIIFYLKCVGKARGYTEKQEIDVHSSKQRSGVLIVPGVANSVEEWLETTRKHKRDIENENPIQ